MGIPLIASQAVTFAEKVAEFASQPIRQMRTGAKLPTDMKLLRQSVWDTDYIPTTIPQQIDTFNSVAYQFGPLAGTTKTEVERYMPGQTSSLANQAFILSSIQFTTLFDVSTGVFPTIGDIQQIRGGVCLALLKNGKEIWYRPQSILPGPGLYGNLSAGSADRFPNAGPAGIMDHLEFDNPVVYYPGQVFGIRLKNSTSTTFQLSQNVRFRITLGGLIIRPQR